jgi:hypothetical protein
MCQFTDVSEVRTAYYVIALIMEAVRASSAWHLSHPDFFLERLRKNHNNSASRTGLRADILQSMEQERCCELECAATTIYSFLWFERHHLLVYDVPQRCQHLANLESTFTELPF